MERPHQVNPGRGIRSHGKLHTMCGRYRLARNKQLLAEYFDTNFDDLDWEPRYNLAPTQPVLVVRQERVGEKSRASLMRWGLIPSRTGDLKSAPLMINARAETAMSKPSFRDPLQRRRCLIPADGFYEWARYGLAEKTKQPFCFEIGNREVFAFAGLWDSWRCPEGGVLESCAILTTTANDLLADMHDRMPVILSRKQYSCWLDPRVEDAEQILTLVAPFQASLMRRHPVSTLVNYVANDGPECSALAELPGATPSLFD